MESFAKVKGQEKVIGVLQRAMQTGNISHAYLFSGPRGTGKKMTAEFFGEEILIQDDPGGKAYLKDRVHPDYLFVDRAEKKSLIGIEKITRELEPWLGTKPYRAEHRVAIIREAHLLSPTAANALLKTLEEPPNYAVIILVSDENNLLETIVSRCQHIRFAPLSEEVIEDMLTNKGVEPEQAKVYARLGQGSMSQAMACAEDGLFEDVWPVTREMITDLSSGKQIEVFRAAERMEKQPMIINLAEVILRDLYVYQETGQSSQLLIPSNSEWCKHFKELNTAYVRRALFNIADLKKQLTTSVNTLLLCINISYEMLDALQ
ncbi:MAG: DNA polymerase III subunit [Bacillota bacterium]|nr:DNA polymerase III subunit [Bacillota bacterium]